MDKMNKVRIVSLVLVIVLGCASIVACGSKTITYWNDIPVYPGTEQVQKGSWSIPAVDTKLGNVKWIYYQTNDSVSEVSAFYEDQMPIAGWKAEASFVTDIIAYGNYTKNNGKDAALAWAGRVVGDGKTNIALMQASE